ncbi:MAG: acyltransferase family protein, partial [Pseudomonadota bacterium]
EQFYLVYPVAFLVLWRTGGDRLFRIVLAVACLSFVLYVGLQLAARHSFAFYATPTRAWQLLAGCALALWQQQRSGWSDVYALLGLASILFSVTGLTALTSSTAVASCVATAGAVAILGSRFDLGPARWILGARPLVAIGLISYSLYLWHQPLLALLHVKTVGHPSPTAYALTIFAVFVVSIASWFLVEQPCRKHRFAGRATVYLTFLFCTGLLAGVGVLGYTSQGLPGRFASDHLLTAIETSPIRSECRAATPCRIGSGVADWAVLGDSHMIELAWALGAHQQRHGKSVVQYTRPGCPPALAFRPNRRGCEAWYRNALQALVDDPEVSRVLVGWRYTAFLFGDHLDVYPGVRSQSVSANFHPDERSISDEDAIDAYWRGVVETVSQLQAAGKTVHIVWPIPELPAHVSELLTPFSVLSRAEPLQAPHGTTWDYYRKRNAVALEKLGRLGYSAQLVAVKPSESVCDASHCFAARDGHVLYFDEDHLSVAGAERVLTSAGVVPEQ